MLQNEAPVYITTVYNVEVLKLYLYETCYPFSYVRYFAVFRILFEHFTILFC